MVTTTKFIWDEDNYLAEADGADTVQVLYTNEPQQYGNLVSQRLGLLTNYCHYDSVGSTRQLTNAAGVTTDTFVYSAWGEQVLLSGTTSIALRWVGSLAYYYDSETQQIYVRKRTLVPSIGRWATVEPALLDIDNRYAYVRNNPTRAVDPSGLVGIYCKCVFGPQIEWVYVSCPGLVTTCCESACPGGGFKPGWLLDWVYYKSPYVPHDCRFQATPTSDAIIEKIQERVKKCLGRKNNENQCYDYTACVLQGGGLSTTRYRVQSGGGIDFYAPATAMALDVYDRCCFRIPKNSLVTDLGIYITDTETGAMLYVHATPLGLGLPPIVFVECPERAVWPQPGP